MSLPKAESDMAPAVVSYLIGIGYDVRSELMDTDIVGIHAQDIPKASAAHEVFLKTKRWPKTEIRSVGVELKRQFSTDVIAQSIRAKRCFGAGIIVVPEPVTTKKTINRKAVEKAQEICNALGVGLLLYCSDGNLRSVCEPDIPSSATLQTKSFVREFLGRSKDMNVGGTTGVKRMTSYAEAVCKIVSFIGQAGIAHVKSITEATKEPKSASILSKNYKELFAPVKRDGKRGGYYCLTAAGLASLASTNATLEAMHISVRWPDYTVPDAWRDAYEKQCGR